MQVNRKKRMRKKTLVWLSPCSVCSRMMPNWASVIRPDRAQAFARRRMRNLHTLSLYLRDRWKMSQMTASDAPMP